jgi:hypothetical protein
MIHYRLSPRVRSVLVPALFAGALAPGSLAAQPASGGSETCGQGDPTASLQLTLPMEVIDHLERVSRSVFVHAFLLEFVAGDRTSGHPYPACARALREARTEQLAQLRQHVPPAPDLLEALRRAESARVNAERNAASIGNINWALDRLVTDQSPGTLDLVIDRFGQTIEGCTWFGICPTVRTLNEQALKLVRQRAQVGTLDLELRRHREQHPGEPPAAPAESAVAPADTAAAGVPPSPLPPPDTAAERLRRWVLDDSLKAAALETARRDAEALRVELLDTLGTFRNRLSQNDRIRLAQRHLGLPTTAMLPPGPAVTVPPLTGPGAPAAVPPSVAAAATDFVIDRAKREIVNGFVVSLYPRAKEERILREIFPDTWNLMLGLAGTPNGEIPATLSAIDVGRVPLTAWRATLTGDFTRLPIRLLSDETLAVCDTRALRLRPVRNTADYDREVRTAFPECFRHRAALSPLVEATTRLIQGDPILRVIADVPDGFLKLPAEAAAELRRVEQGVFLVGELASAYVAQGSVLAADPERHPFVLTARSLKQARGGQQRIMTNLLLIRLGTQAGQSMPTVVKLEDLDAAIERVVGHLERIAQRTERPDLTRAEAAVAVRSGFDAIGEGIDLARALGAAESPAMREIADRWRDYGSVVEPLIGGDYGLAFGRSMILFQQIRNTALPAPVTTFLALSASLSEAQDGEQLRRAFEAAASPVGGWQAQRQGLAGLAVVAYPGANYTRETVSRRAEDPQTVGTGAHAAGLALPVGLHLQSGYGLGCPFICSFGVFVPLLDLGTMFSYRLNGADGVQDQPNGSLRQLFAPGVFGTFAFSRTFPLSLYGGWQFVPDFRQVEGTGDAPARGVRRWVVGTGVDVNLFSIRQGRGPLFGR